MKEYKIIDNFLSEEDCTNIVKNTLENTYFPLFLKNGVSSLNVSKDGIYFTHNFFSKGKINCPYFNLLLPILEKISPLSNLRIQFNLYPQTFFRKKHNYHKDYDFQHKGMIYYLNTNNGQTILHNNIKVKPVKSIKLVKKRSSKENE